MIKIIQIFLIFLIINNYVFSQEKIIPKNIEWKAKLVRITKIDKENFYYINFENAVYKDLKNLLPYYSETINIENLFNSTNISARIVNLKFSKINDNNINKIKAIDKINSSIKVETKIVYLRKKAFLQISFIPLIKSTNGLEKLIEFDILLKQENTKKVLKISRTYASKSVLKTGKWIKIKTTKAGVYKLSFYELKSLGITNPANVRIFGNSQGMLDYLSDGDYYDDLQENKILIENNSVIFYATAASSWEYNETEKQFNNKNHLYSTGSYYFLSSDYNSGFDNVIKKQAQHSEPITHNITNFNSYKHHEIDTFNLIKSGQQWFGEIFDIYTNKNFDFEFSNIVSGSKINIKVSGAARSTFQTSFNISANGTNNTMYFLKTNYSSTDDYAMYNSQSFSFNSNGEKNINLQIEYIKKSASDKAWLDYITINALEYLKYDEKQLFFRNFETIGTNNVTKFNIESNKSSVRIWDISNPISVSEVEFSYTSNNLTYITQTNTLKEYIVFDENTYLSPIVEGDDLGEIENQNLHGLGQYNMLIVCNKKFIDYANELATHHKTNDNLSVYVTTQEKIYNEFSSGSDDVSAVRDYVKMFYDRASNESEIPKYLLLFGDGSYDNKKIFEDNTNLVVTYQSPNSLSPTASFVSDDFFGLLDDGEAINTGLVDIGIGRLPVKNTEEAENAVKKIISYSKSSSIGDWRSYLCFIADDEDGNIYIDDSETICKIIETNAPSFNVEKVYLDAFLQVSGSTGQRYPEVTNVINNRMRKGCLLVNYIGHGGTQGLTHERVIGVSDITSWDNFDRLPLFMTATCEFSRFDDFESTSAGEKVFLNPNGGAIALLSTTRLVYSNPNFYLNKSFAEVVFTQNNNDKRLGDIIRKSKNLTSSGINKRNFTLLGDPAVRLAYPENNINTLKINNKNIDINNDTLKALSKITISGELTDIQNNRKSNFTGVVFPVVFDKEKTVTTLNNDGVGAYDFASRNNILYKGKASVKNGVFSFSFIVPKDIMYNFGEGKISYYAYSSADNSDAIGYFSNIIVGGTSNEVNNDTKGPEIKLHLNDENFVYGGITNQNPKILAYVNDEYGINTVGNGIGHDILATIDNNSNSSIILNDYYESDIDSYQSGKIEYNLYDIANGEHTLKLKVWDINNNSSEEEIEFTVLDSKDIEISHVLNYPNPFTSNTSFFFEHNKPNTNLDVLIQIYTVTGKVIKTINTQVNSNGFRSNAISWDGKNDYGNRIGRGVYIYNIKVRTPDGQLVSKFEKLLILK